MNKWIPMNGKFEEINSKIIFKGGIYSQLGQVPNVSQDSKCGLLIFDEALSNGLIEMTVEFSTLGVGDEAQIVFNYQSEKSFMCAGIINGTSKFEFKHFDGQWHYENYAGFADDLPKKLYSIKIEISGSLISLYIDNIRVMTTLSKRDIHSSNIGIWARSKGDITFSNFKSSYQKPQAFVVSEFGNDYDYLYNEVIKPVCDNYKFETTRADEISSSTLILNDITESIRNAALVIADISPNNPNVFYEVGYAHAINKPTILLCDKSIRSNLPFDVSGFRTIFYDNSIGGKKIVEKRLMYYIENIAKSTSIRY